MIRARRYAVLAAVWAVPALLCSMEAFYYHRSDPWGPITRATLPWMLWVPLTPVVLARGARIGGWRAGRIAVDAALAVAIGAVFGTLSGSLSYLVKDWGGGPHTYADYLSMGVIDWVPLQPLVYAGVLAAGIAVEGARRRRIAEVGRAELEAQLANAQLAALRAQLHPHFLFNTLNAAVALARAGDAAGTARVLVLLGDLLRQLLRGDAPQEVPLRDELALLEIYLEIQRIRLGERLQIGWDIADDVRDALVPQLVLQPLVENALQHGIARKSRAGRLDIAAARRGDQLRLTVCDDGPGVAASFSLAATTGVGLRNTQERLHRLYGARGALALATAGDRTTAAVELPMRGETAGG